MKPVKLSTLGVIGSRSICALHCRTQLTHARRDAELRMGGHQQHENNKDIVQGKQFQLLMFLPVIKQGSDEEDQSAKQPCPVQLIERRTHHVTRKFNGRQHAEQGWRFYKGKENDPANPDDQREEHEKTYEGHGGKSISLALVSRCFRNFERKREIPIAMKPQ